MKLYIFFIAQEKIHVQADSTFWLHGTKSKNSHLIDCNFLHTY